MSKRAYQLLFYGFRERELNALHMLFESHSEIAQIALTENTANIAIVDLDGADHQAVWQEVKEAFAGPVIALSVREREYADPQRYISKPYHSDLLIKAIVELGAELTADKKEPQPVVPETTAPAVEQPDPEPTVSAAKQPDPEPSESLPEQPLELVIEQDEPGCNDAESTPDADEFPATAAEFDEVDELAITQAAEIVLQEESAIEESVVIEENFIVDEIIVRKATETPDADEDDAILAEMEALLSMQSESSEVEEISGMSARNKGDNGPHKSEPTAVDASDYAYMLSDEDFQPEDSDNTIYYQPADMLQGVIAEVLSTARQTRTPVQVVGLGEAIYLCPLRDIVQTALQEENLNSLCRISISLDKLKISLLDERQAASLISDSRENTESMAGFLWKITVLCARGRLPVGTQLDQPVQLVIPPELTLPAMAEGEAIAKAWRDGKISILETPERLKISYRDVYNFYSAAKALGLIMEYQPKQQGLLGRLFNRME